MIERRIVLCCVMLLALALGQALAHTQGRIVFSDSAVWDEDWSLELFQLGNGGSVVASQQMIGGHPDAFGRSPTR
jgi:hypothetical protein